MVMVCDFAKKTVRNLLEPRKKAASYSFGTVARLFSQGHGKAKLGYIEECGGITFIRQRHSTVTRVVVL